MEIPTVKIKADNAKGSKIINQSDFDPKKHKKWTAAKPAKPRAKRKTNG
jgi:hypothetical protein